MIQNKIDGQKVVEAARNRTLRCDHIMEALKRTSNQEEARAARRRQAGSKRRAAPVEEAKKDARAGTERKRKSKAKAKGKNQKCAGSGWATGCCSRFSSA